MSLIFIWLTLSFAGAAVLIVLLFWLADRYFKDE
jgi:hypothetical protein